MAATDRVVVRLNSAAVRRVLKSAGVADAVKRIADDIAAGVDDQKLTASSGWAKLKIPPEIVGTVTVSESFDRARAVVRINHPAGAAMQATHGVMSKAASSAGVTPHPPK